MELAEGRENLLIQGIVVDGAELLNLRQVLSEQVLYGRVSLDKGDFKKLKYADNLINLVIVEDLPRLLEAGLDLREVIRILCPGGIALVGKSARLGDPPLSQAELESTLAAAEISEYEIVTSDGVFARIRKERPAGMDEWTHQRYAAHGNAVSRDTYTPSNNLRWWAGPCSDRSFHAQELQVEISANGRNFYLTSAETSNLFCAKKDVNWYLIARDAYNGLFLWSRRWQSILPPKVFEYGFSLHNRDLEEGWQKRPATCLDRRNYPLAAVGDYVYIGERNKVVILSAATGEVVQESVPLDSFVDIVLFDQGHLIAATVNKVVSINPADGTIRWQYPSDSTTVMAMDLVSGDGKVFFLDTKERPYYLIGLNIATGQEIFKTDMAPYWPPEPDQILGGIGLEGPTEGNGKEALNCSALNFIKKGFFL
jgi:hypothetical protein